MAKYWLNHLWNMFCVHKVQMARLAGLYPTRHQSKEELSWTIQLSRSPVLRWDTSRSASPRGKCPGAQARRGNFSPSLGTLQPRKRTNWSYLESWTERNLSWIWQGPSTSREGKRTERWLPIGGKWASKAREKGEGLQGILDKVKGNCCVRDRKRMEAWEARSIPGCLL